MITSCRDWKACKPRWVPFSAFGPYSLKKGGREEDYHYHDCDEYIIVTSGQGTLLLEGRRRPLEPGVIVAIPRGGRHQITKVTKDLTVLWIYDQLKGRKRAGHIPQDTPGRAYSAARPVMVTSVYPGWREKKPAWSRLTDMGILTYKMEPIDMDYHYHDCHEYYFIMAGKIRIILDGLRRTAKFGDIVCIKKGTMHTLIAAGRDDSCLTWLMDELTGRRQYGHLHLKYNLAVSKTVRR